MLIYAAIVLSGIAAFSFYLRSSDFIGEDVFYADSARSLLNHGFYGINGHPETNQPPGLPAMLAFLFSIFGYSFSICLRTIAFFEALGFVAVYEVLKRHSSRLVAAVICLLLVTSPVYFQQATQAVNPAMPVLFATMAAVFAFLKYDRASTRKMILAWGLILTAAVVAALMFASASMALLGAMLATVGATFFKDRRLARERARKLLPVLLIGLTVQGLWMHRKPAPLDWPLPGYPAPYLQQLRVKSGNYPELGMAGVGDIATRIESNALKQMDLLAQIVLRHGVNVSKVAIAIAPALPIAGGWAYAMWETNGESLLAWYFAGYEFIYLLWPWGVERRFFLPIAPLACFYAWKGVKAMAVLVMARPRLIGIIWSPIGLILGISGSLWLYVHRADGWGMLPDELLVPVWLISSVWGAWIAFKDRPPAFLMSIPEHTKSLTLPSSLFQLSVRHAPRYVFGALLVMLVGFGFRAEARIALDNVALPDFLRATDPSTSLMAKDIEGAMWIRSHTPANSVVMARHVPVVYHYSERSLVWFPPSSNAEILMRGVRAHNVNYVIVVKHQYPYYLPDDDYCFNNLLNKYRDAFRLAFQDPNLRIFEVESSHK